MGTNYKISFFRLLPYILVELVVFFFVDYILHAEPPLVSDGTLSYVAFATYFIPVSLMVIRIKSLLAKWALVLGSLVYLAFALDMVLSRLHHAGHFLESAIMFVPGFIVLLVVVARTDFPWDWRTLFR